MMLCRSVVCFLVMGLGMAWPTTLVWATQRGPCYWPQFHGPKRDSISTETGLLRLWPPEGPRLLWTAQGLGEGFTTVTIADGLIYTAGNRDGATVRSRAANGGAWTGQSPGTRGAPTLDGTRLYHESPLGHLVCLEAKTGRLLWHVDLLETFGSENITWALSESVLIDGDRVICCPGGPQTAVVALDKYTGKTLWKSPSAGDLAGYASPVLAEWEGLRIILTMTARALIGVDADSGDLLFRFEHLTPFDENILTPIFHNGRVFISTRTTGSVMLQLLVQGRKATVREVWRSRDLDNQHGGVILLDGYLYGASLVNRNGRWVCLDWNTGQTMFTQPQPEKGSLVFADGLIYTMSERGEVSLVEPSPKGLKIISQFRLPRGGQGPTWAHPVVCGGRLYLRHGDFLYAYDIRARQ